MSAANLSTGQIIQYQKIPLWYDLRSCKHDDDASMLNRGMVSRSRYEEQEAELDEEMLRISR